MCGPLGAMNNRFFNIDKPYSVVVKNTEVEKALLWGYFSVGNLLGVKNGLQSSEHHPKLKKNKLINTFALTEAGNQRK